MAGAYSDKPNNAHRWLPCESSETTQECAGSNPPYPLQSKIYSRQQTAQQLYESKWCATGNSILYLQIKN